MKASCTMETGYYHMDFKEIEKSFQKYIVQYNLSG